MFVLPEAVGESSRVSRRIPEHGPDDFRSRVRKRPFRDLPYRVVDRGGLVEDDENPLALIVQSCESLRVVFAPRDRVDTPRLFVRRIRGEDRCRRDGKSMFQDEQIVPLRKLRPCFRAKLIEIGRASCRERV